MSSCLMQLNLLLVSFLLVGQWTLFQQLSQDLSLNIFV